MLKRPDDPQRWPNYLRLIGEREIGGYLEDLQEELAKHEQMYLDNAALRRENQRLWEDVAYYRDELAIYKYHSNGKREDL